MLDVISLFQENSILPEIKKPKNVQKSHTLDSHNYVTALEKRLNFAHDS